MRTTIAVSILLLTFMLGGCWDRHEVDEIAIVVGLGIDRIPGDQPILLTAQVVNPMAVRSGEGLAGEKKPQYLMTSQGKTVQDAINNFAANPRRFIFSHNKMIVLGKAYAESGIMELMDHIDRGREFRENQWVLVAKETAKEIVQTKVPLQSLSAVGLHHIMTQLQQHAFALPEKYHDFSDRLKGDLGIAVAPQIELENKEKEANEKLAEMTGAEVGKSETGVDKVVKIESTAIFEKYRIVGMIDKDQSRGLIWLRDKLINGMVIVPVENRRQVTITIDRGRSNMTPIINGDRITMKIECVGDAHIDEVEQTGLEVKDEKTVEYLQKEVENILINRIKSTIFAAQKEMNVDFIEYSHAIQNRYPHEWKRLKPNWKELFPEIQSEVEVQITIKSIGLRTNSE